MTKLIQSLFAFSIIIASATVCFGQSPLDDFYGSQDASVDEQSDTKTCILNNCITMSIKDVDVPALESGQITKINVKEGDNVLVNDLAAQLNDTLAQRMKAESEFRFQSAKSRAQDSTQVEAGKKKVILAKDERDKNRRLLKTNAVSMQIYKRSEYSYELAIHELEGAKNARTVAAIDASAEQVKYFAAEDSIKRHEIRSTVNGQVFAIDRVEGEWITAGERIMRIAQVDRLRVQGNVPGTKYDPHQIENCEVTVTVLMANERPVSFKGYVTFVGLQKAGDSRYAVWAEVENKKEFGSWILRSGSRVKMHIHLDRKKTNPSTANSSDVEFPISR